MIKIEEKVSLASEHLEVQYQRLVLIKLVPQSVT